MIDSVIGPRLSDESLFTQCLDLSLPCLAKVKACVESRDWVAARKALASVMRAQARPGTYFSIPYEAPENEVMFPGETEAQACERILRHTLISVGVACDYGADHPVDWEANPTYNQYLEWPWQLNRHHEWKMLAHRYRDTKDDRYAFAFAELFASWVHQALVPDNVPGYETLTWRTIECGIRQNTTWPYAYLTFVHHPALTDDLLIDWLKSVWEHGQRLSQHHMDGNWLIMEMNGLAQLCVLYPFFCQTPAWKAQAFQALSEQLDIQLYPEGFQYELTTNYHHVVVRNYERFIFAMRAWGEPVPQDILDKLLPAARFEYKLMMPDGTTPDLNDGRRLPLREIFASRLQVFPEDPILQWVVNPDSTPAPASGLLSMPYAGFMIGRTGWQSDDTFVLMDGGPFGKAHQHEDMLNVLLYAKRKLLLTEGGIYAYDESPMRRYVLSSHAHNTVLVDGKGQNRRRHYDRNAADVHTLSRLVCHETQDGWFGMSRYDEGYGEDCDRSVIHERRLLFVPGPEPYMIVVDRLLSDAPHTYEALWHVDDPQMSRTECLQHFEHLDIAVSSGQMRVVTGQESPQWQGWIAIGQRQGQYRAVPCLINQIQGTSTRSVTVLVPHDSQLPTIHHIEASSDIKETGLLLVWSDGHSCYMNEQDWLVPLSPR